MCSHREKGRFGPEKRKRNKHSRLPLFVRGKIEEALEVPELVHLIPRIPLVYGGERLASSRSHPRQRSVWAVQIRCLRRGIAIARAASGAPLLKSNWSPKRVPAKRFAEANFLRRLGHVEKKKVLAPWLQPKSGFK